MSKKIHPIQTKKYRKILKKLGWRYDRIRGDHEIWMKDGMDMEVVFITNEKDVPPFIILQNLSTLGITREEFLKML